MLSKKEEKGGHELPCHRISTFCLIILRTTGANIDYDKLTNPV